MKVSTYKRVVLDKAERFDVQLYACIVNVKIIVVQDDGSFSMRGRFRYEIGGDVYQEVPVPGTFSNTADVAEMPKKVAEQVQQVIDSIKNV